MNLEQLPPEGFEKRGFQVYGTKQLGADKTQHRAELIIGNYKIKVDTYCEVYFSNPEGATIQVACKTSMDLDNLIQFVQSC